MDTDEEEDLDTFVKRARARRLPTGNTLNGHEVYYDYTGSEYENLMRNRGYIRDPHTSKWTVPDAN